MSHDLKWQPGHFGKGYVDEDGTVHNWPVEYRYGPPHHAEVYSGEMMDTAKMHTDMLAHEIDPEGNVAFSVMSDQFDPRKNDVFRADSRLSDPTRATWDFDPWSDSREGSERPQEPLLDAPYANRLKEWLDTIPGPKPPLTPYHDDEMEVAQQGRFSKPKKPVAPKVDPKDEYEQMKREWYDEDNEQSALPYPYDPKPWRTDHHAPSMGLVSSWWFD